MAKDIANDVVLITFADPAKCYEELAVLENYGGPPIDVLSAAVVENQNGTLVVKAGFDNKAGTGTAVGGLIGMIIGVLAGPLGMLLGWCAGSMFGTDADIDDDLTIGSFLYIVGDLVPPGQSAVIAHIEEADPNVLDKQVAEAGGTIKRWTAEEVLNDLSAAEQVQANMAAQAAANLKQVRGADRKAELRTKLEKLRQKV